MQNNRTRQFGGSPIFTGGSESDTLASGETAVYDFSKNASASEKYAPFNFLKVYNTDTSNDLKIKINQDDDKEVLVTAGTVQTFDSQSFPAIHSILVENIGDSSNSSYRIEVQKEVVNTQDIISGAVAWVFGMNSKRRV